MGHYVYKYVHNDEIIYIGKCDKDLEKQISQHGKKAIIFRSKHGMS